MKPNTQIQRIFLIVLLMSSIFKLSISKGEKSRKIRSNDELLDNELDGDTSDDDKYIESFKATVEEDPKRPEIKNYFDAMVEVRREKLLSFLRKKYLNIKDDGKQQLADTYAEYNPDPSKMYSDHEVSMRGGGKAFRIKENQEFIDTIIALEKDYKFFPKTIFELGAGQGRLTAALNKYYVKKNRDVVIDILEPFKSQIVYLKKKKLSKLNEIYVLKAEDFYCKEPKYDYIFGGWISIFVPDKYLPKLFIMLRSCLKEGGFIYFKEHFKFGVPKFLIKGLKFRNPEILSTVMSLAGFTPILLEESTIRDEDFKRELRIIAKLN